MITTWTTGHADENMDESLLIELRSLIEHHPWWWARARLVLALLQQLGIAPPSRILDAGCGWGVTLTALERVHYHAIGMDISRCALDQLDQPGRLLIEADL